MSGRRTLLWIAEAVTLAHVARPLAALRGAAHSAWRSIVAADARARQHVAAAGADFEPLTSIEPARFLQALAHGRPVYDEATLRAYVDADLALLSRVQPDLVIGDFRLSLSISARLAGVRYATLASACWSPAYEPAAWPVPALSLTKAVPLPVAATLFGCARPIAFRRHAAPMNRVRRAFGLAPLQGDVRNVYTDADDVLYADLPELFPLSLPPRHRFVGPPLWEPHGAEAPMWPAFDSAPRLYVTLGSSGASSLLPAIVAALGTMNVTAVVATAHGATPATPANVVARDFVPGLAAARGAHAVVCNGGTLGCYQALAAGVPVVGIASNLEQFLTMQAVERAGAGVLVRADRFSAAALRAGVERALHDAALRTGAKRAAQWCATHPLDETIARYLHDVQARA
jgi:UDP:flavonoid glycosyltransferase YjiC (YdhE family)